MNLLDCRQKSCPAPVIETRKQIMAHPGETFDVLVSDDVSRDNVSRLAEKQNYQVETATTDDGFSLRLIPAEIKTREEQQTAVTGETIVFIASDKIGSGDDELGMVLMKNFIMTLHELNKLPNKILFLNGGVKLTCQDSDLIETLNDLACNGVDIVSCGLCLEFFGLREKLSAGRVGNMLETVEAMANAGRVIRP